MKCWKSQRRLERRKVNCTRSHCLCIDNFYAVYYSFIISRSVDIPLAFRLLWCHQDAKSTSTCLSVLPFCLFLLSVCPFLLSVCPFIPPVSLFVLSVCLLALFCSALFCPVLCCPTLLFKTRYLILVFLTPKSRCYLVRLVYSFFQFNFLEILSC